ncbi:hypothetical protein [Crocosphaera sp. XPORK-15E]|uniref:hypothetical protein n=1 Tax=Crocosphaera sp. XPORK-15E TaxID=3110247 RepID=UPI002B217F05|nr:hypothetical protein [Crocosphaera sp. XPORK-15E]MEA5532830.1 hypothetical protein [Crocosphaera sp. XPORK-15E]
MNRQLVESLISIFQSLSEEERQIFEQQLFFNDHQVNIQDIMNLAEKSHCFDFLNNEPDIYTLEDGKPI